MLTTIEQLVEIYGPPMERAVTKEIPYLNEDYQAFVKASPLVILASTGYDGMDCSPKGDVAGFVVIEDARTLLLPDRPGNNRIDTLRNLIVDPHIGLLFFVPGIGEMLRVNGRAEISNDPELLARFAVNDKLPRTVTIVHIESAYFHCSKALMRSDLWNPENHVPRTSLPSTGNMIKRLNETFDAETYDRELVERARASFY